MLTPAMLAHVLIWIGISIVWFLLLVVGAFALLLLAALISLALDWMQPW